MYEHVIETSYGGKRFRSRLEARWSVFLDALGISYLYEPDAYDLGVHGAYLPDFLLLNVPMRNRSGTVFAEIKPVMPDNTYLWKLAAFVTVTQAPLLLLTGPVGPGGEDGERFVLYEWTGPVLKVGGTARMRFYRCPSCRRCRIDLTSSYYEIVDKRTPEITWRRVDVEQSNYVCYYCGTRLPEYDGAMLGAAAQALSYRFEPRAKQRRARPAQGVQEAPAVQSPSENHRGGRENG